MFVVVMSQNVQKFKLFFVGGFFVLFFFLFLHALKMFTDGPLLKSCVSLWFLFTIVYVCSQ